MAGEGSWIRVNAVAAGLDAQTVNSIIKVALSKRAVSITQMPELRQKIGEAYVKAVTPFVPVKSTDLRESGRATDDGRVYWTAVNKYGDNYAGYVFDPDETRWPDGEYSHSQTSGKYPRWTEHVQPQPGNEAYDGFIAEVTDIVRKEFAKYE